MSEYNFYYDEAEHSRKINQETVTAHNYYGNFLAVIVGCKKENTAKIFDKYAAFETKYNLRKSKGELKSSTLRPDQFENGFASLSKDNVIFLNDFLTIIDFDFFIYYAVINKIEFLINQLFVNYHSDLNRDMDAIKYSIVKAISLYQPKEIIEVLFKDNYKLVETLKKFFRNRIEINKTNRILKEKESLAFQDILEVLDKIAPNKNNNWNYKIAFWGFENYIEECNIKDFTLTIDKEGSVDNTFKAAKNIGFANVEEQDSKNSEGIRIADMLVGVISKLLKALHNALRYNSTEEQTKKKLLNKEWFILKQGQLELYKKLCNILCNMNQAYYKLFIGTYADDIITMIALLNYMDKYTTSNDIEIDMQGERFNTYACEYLENYYNKLKNKLPIDIVPLDNVEYIINRRGAKVYSDVSKQPNLKFVNGKCACEVLSVGIDKGNNALITVQENGTAVCYRLPDGLFSWAFNAVTFANKGDNVFPTRVIFSEYKGIYHAETYKLLKHS